MSRQFKLVAVAPGSSYTKGYRYLGYDKDIVVQRGTWVHLEGTAGIREAHVVRHDPDRKLLYVKHVGYTAYISRGSGNSYQPACFRIYEYDEHFVGNEIHLTVDLFGIAELPLGWKPEHVRKD